MLQHPTQHNRKNGWVIMYLNTYLKQRKLLATPWLAAITCNKLSKVTHIIICQVDQYISAFFTSAGAASSCLDKRWCVDTLRANCTEQKNCGGDSEQFWYNEGNKLMSHAGCHYTQSSQTVHWQYGRQREGERNFMNRWGPTLPW